MGTSPLLHYRAGFEFIPNLSIKCTTFVFISIRVFIAVRYFIASDRFANTPFNTIVNFNMVGLLRKLIMQKFIYVSRHHHYFLISMLGPFGQFYVDNYD